MIAHHKLNVQAAPHTLCVLTASALSVQTPERGLNVCVVISMLLISLY